jgi:hypothetical protein
MKMRSVKVEATLLMKVITTRATHLWHANVGLAVQEVTTHPLEALVLSSCILLGACWGIASEKTAVFLVGALLVEHWGISVNGGRGEE